jgi:hypothetical protein
VVARFSEEDRKTIWDMREAGVPVRRIALDLGRQNYSAGRRHFPGSSTISTKATTSTNHPHDQLHPRLQFARLQCR